MTAPKRVNLALQGGGSHGAFTWGVLDAILEDERLEIAALSGTSAGAMNAVVLAAGLLDGRAAAREKLKRFWFEVAQASAPGSTLPGVGAWLTLVKDTLAPPSFAAASADAISPYAFNPLNYNPLIDILGRVVEFERLRATATPKLFIAATNVRTGKGAVFTRDKLTPEHVMASATLPHLFQAVEIGGRYYWDGGYSGNPPLTPLFRDSECGDTILVQINPIYRNEIPQTPQEISNRIDEVSFNASLIAELRYLLELSRLAHKQGLTDPRFNFDRLHRIGGDGKLERFAADTKFDASWGFLQSLRNLGRESAKEWLATHFDAIGAHATHDAAQDVNETEDG